MAGTDADHPVTSRALVTFVSTVFSLLLHGAVLAAVVHWIEPDPGAVAFPTEAVSIELLQSEVLEAVATAPALEAAASAASVQSDPGDATESVAVSAQAPDQIRPVEPEAAQEIAARDAETAASQGLDILQGSQESDVAAGVEEPSPVPAASRPDKPSRETKERKRPVKTAKLTEPTERRKEESRPRKKGAASSRATTGAAASAGRVSASSGSSINYAAIVRARVASRKPPGGGQRGTVVVAFGVSRSGGLTFARVSRSSGNAGLDQRVLAAVRGAGPFPPPPPGANLRFAIPFHFR